MQEEPEARGRADTVLGKTQPLRSQPHSGYKVSLSLCKNGSLNSQVWTEEGLGGHSLANELFGTDRSREKVVMTFSCVSPSDPIWLQRIISIQYSY